MIKDRIPIIQAIADGKTAQIRRRTHGPWEDTIQCSRVLDSNFVEARVKPEPKYGPIDFDGCKQLVGKPILNSVSGDVYMVLGTYRNQAPEEFGIYFRSSNSAINVPVDELLCDFRYYNEDDKEVIGIVLEETDEEEDEDWAEDD